MADVAAVAGCDRKQLSVPFAAVICRPCVLKYAGSDVQIGFFLFVSIFLSVSFSLSFSLLHSPPVVISDPAVRHLRLYLINIESARVRDGSFTR